MAITKWICLPGPTGVRGFPHRVSAAAFAPGSGKPPTWISRRFRMSTPVNSGNSPILRKRSGNKMPAAIVSFRNPETSAMTNRRDTLKCLGVGAGTLFTLSGGVFSAFDMAEAHTDMGTPLFLQISDTHIGFNKEANPDV